MNKIKREVPACCVADLVRWFQHLCCTGNLAKAEPELMRWALWHTPARIMRRAERGIDGHLV